MKTQKAILKHMLSDEVVAADTHGVYRNTIVNYLSYTNAADYINSAFNSEDWDELKYKQSPAHIKMQIRINTEDAIAALVNKKITSFKRSVDRVKVFVWILSTSKTPKFDYETIEDLQAICHHFDIPL